MFLCIKSISEYWIFAHPGIRDNLKQTVARQYVYWCVPNVSVSRCINTNQDVSRRIERGIMTYCAYRCVSVFCISVFWCVLVCIIAYHCVSMRIHAYPCVSMRIGAYRCISVHISAYRCISVCIGAYLCACLSAIVAYWGYWCVPRVHLL
jgi:hypothetical protein